uniref:Uncharacterized protein n=1 Tax=Podoviridae sp. ctU7u6 TaxID=2825252 RepID=A0A8S5P858_9CAUD|nr:MAG TPA: hypothetical protein [Podoviridae sp. ctU7u6]
MKKHYETHVEDTDKLISVAGPVLDYKSWYEQYRKLMEEQAQRKYGLYTPTSEGDDDDFPSITGMIARYSASGLTNEQMAANPVWVDKTGNGHDLQMKNFSWKGMSGVGGYEMNFNLWRNNVSSIPDISMSTTTTSVSVSVGNSTYNNNLICIHISNWDINKNHWLKVTSTYEDGDLAFIFYNDSNTKKIGLPANGYVNILAYPEFKGSYMYISTISNKQGSFTIEQLPLYPGALVFDGVDDWAGCDNLPLLPKEKGYSIIALRNWITRYDATQYKRPLISNLDTNDEGAFLIEYRKDENVNDVTGSYNSFTDVYIDDNNPITWQTSSSYNGQIIKKGTSKSTNKLCICKTYFGQLSNYANAAIWEIVILDHDATEEELTKIKDYFVKTYPWLFPDQAWTVVGKTNEDEDRATIANITGNGNDLILSNFGFAEGSGYGLYAENYAGGRWVQSTDRADLTWTSYSVNITSVKVASTQLYYQSYPEQPSFIVPSYKIKVYGLKDGQTLSYRQATSEGQQLYKISEDGTYTLPSFPFKANGDWYGFTLNKVQESCDITIEQIPEYEGYLITDGVDDEIISAKLIQFADKFTIVGDWKFMEDRNDKAGLLKANQIYIYNATTGMRIYLKQGSRHYSFSCKKINALTSDGWVYDEKWDKYKVYPIGSDIDISSRLFLGFYSSNFTKIALKNLGIYNDQLLSKDDCIKAYNYLQTLKSK